MAKVGARAGWPRRARGGSALFTINRVLVAALVAALLGTLTVHRCTGVEIFGDGAGENATRASGSGMGGSTTGHGASLPPERGGWRYRL